MEFLNKKVFVTLLFGGLFFVSNESFSGAFVTGNGVGTTGGPIATTDEVMNVRQGIERSINNAQNSVSRAVANGFNANISTLTQNKVEIVKELRSIVSSIVNQGKTEQTAKEELENSKPVAKNIKNDFFQKKSKVINDNLRCKGSSTLKGESKANGYSEAVSAIIAEQIDEDIKGPPPGSIGMTEARKKKVANDPVINKLGTGIFNSDNISEDFAVSGKDFIGVVAEPNPRPQLSEVQKRQKAGKKYQEEKKLKDAENKLARDILSNRLSESTALVDGSFLAVLLPRTSENLDILAKINNNEKISNRQIEKAMVSYFNSSDSFKKREALSATNADGISERKFMAELNTMQAYSLKLQLKLLRTLQNIETLLAQEAIDRVNQKYEGKLDELYSNVLTID